MGTTRTGDNASAVGGIAAWWRRQRRIRAVHGFGDGKDGDGDSPASQLWRVEKGGGNGGEGWRAMVAEPTAMNVESDDVPMMQRSVLWAICFDWTHDHWICVASSLGWV